MKIDWTCINCEKEFPFDETEDFGKKIKCPHCNQWYEVYFDCDHQEAVVIPNPLSDTFPTSVSTLPEQPIDSVETVDPIQLKPHPTISNTLISTNEFGEHFHSGTFTFSKLTIPVKCEHCGNELDLSKEDTCSRCGISHFASPKDVENEWVIFLKSIEEVFFYMSTADLAKYLSAQYFIPRKKV